MKSNIILTSFLLFCQVSFVHCEPSSEWEDIQSLDNDAEFRRLVNAGIAAGATVSTLFSLIYLAPVVLSDAVELIREVAEELNRSSPVGSASLNEFDAALQSAVMVLLFIIVTPCYLSILILDVAGVGAVAGAVIAASILKCVGY